MILFCCSKNNYYMLEIWLNNNLLPSDIIVINIDVGSDIEQLEFGKDLCEKRGVIFFNTDNPAIQNCYHMAVEFAKSQSCEWVVYFQQDTYGLEKHFYANLQKRLTDIGYSEKLGFLGVNIYHDESDIAEIDGSIKWMTSARCFVQKGDGWYRRFAGCRVDYGQFENKDFIAESIFWVVGACNTRTFDECVKVDCDFQFFLGFDDMLYQCLLKNRYHVVLCGLDAVHNQNLKASGHLPKKSTVASSSTIAANYGRQDYLDVWKTKHGFSFIFRKQKFSSLPKPIERVASRTTRVLMPRTSSGLDTVARAEYLLLKNENKSVITDMFYCHDPKFGPLKYLEDLI